ncbi:hypothetical protein BROUX41_005927 [Berkeleyomyces rouxiae]|uniref:uncharacterized protein n=1 Tax=Berkeleyomyces rouxiae TaxID=2035830 RepID=UPI003B805FF6
MSSIPSGSSPGAASNVGPSPVTPIGGGIGAGPGPGSGPSTRVSQRASRSCTECKRRKIRCDKTVPCNQCLRAKAPGKCRIEMVELTTKYTKSRQEIEFLHQLKMALTATTLVDAEELITARLTLLETGQEPVKARKSMFEGSSEYFNDVLNDQHADETFDTAKTLMRLGRGYPNPVAAMDQVVPVDSDFNMTILNSVPDLVTARKLVSYYLEHLSWHHAVLHHGEFLAQCEAYWASGSMVTSQWACVYFAVLSASAYNLPERLYAMNDTRVILRQNSEFWYNQMFLALFRTDYTVNHSAFTLQAIIISCMVAHPLGQAVRQMVLLSSSLRIAQCLDYAAHTPSKIATENGMTDLSKKITEEVQRRIWWQILVQDYFLVPMAGSYGVSPNHFTTPMPLNCHDDMIEQPSDVPTISSYCIQLSKMALLMPQLIDGLRSPKVTTREAQYRHVQFIAQKMTQVMNELPIFLRVETPFDPSWPVWIEWARSTLTISAADKFIMIHRSFLIKSFQDPQTYELTRRTCVSSALTILNEFRRVKNKDVVRLWIIPTFTVSAAIVIGLDISYRIKNNEAYEAKHFDLLIETIDALKTTLVDCDVTVRQGVGLLESFVSYRLGTGMSPSARDSSSTLHDDLLGYLGEDAHWGVESQF